MTIGAVTDWMSTRGTCVVVDLENYSSLDGVRQVQAQEALADVLARAAMRAGLRRPDWCRQPAGDGELAVLPATEPQADVVGTFPLALDALLREREAVSGLRLRVRMAIVDGRVTTAAMGFADHAVIAAGRMADAPPVRHALATSAEGRLVLALSAGLYRDVIRHGDTAIAPQQFRRVPIECIQSDAWITIIGVDPDELVPAAEDRPPDPTDGDRYRTEIGTVSTQTFHIGPRRG